MPPEYNKVIDKYLDTRSIENLSNENFIISIHFTTYINFRNSF